MAVEYPSLADGCAHSDIPPTLTRDIYNSPMANYVPPPFPSFGQVKTCLIHKDHFMGNRPSFNLKDSLNIFHTLVFHSVRVSFERDSVCLFHPELILSEDAVNCGEADGIYASKKMIILNHSPLNLLQADYIICNYHVYKFPLLLLRQKP